MDEIISIRDLKELADQFALYCVVREKEVTIIGEKLTIIFKRQEKDICQLIQIIEPHQ